MFLSDHDLHAVCTSLERLRAGIVGAGADSSSSPLPGKPAPPPKSALSKVAPKTACRLRLEQHSVYQGSVYCANREVSHRKCLKTPRQAR